mmetsp:Transcript_17248/g.34711  ORF Transcript_17248/g.34711 Transcript_17248/m.34711 type:complete len:298 (-) Transcript_17248:27-920(-)
MLWVLVFVFFWLLAAVEVVVFFSRVVLDVVVAACATNLPRPIPIPWPGPVLVLPANFPPNPRRAIAARLATGDVIRVGIQIAYLAVPRQRRIVNVLLAIRDIAPSDEKRRHRRMEKRYIPTRAPFAIWAIAIITFATARMTRMVVFHFHCHCCVGNGKDCRVRVRVLVAVVVVAAHAIVPCGNVECRVVPRCDAPCPRTRRNSRRSCGCSPRERDCRGAASKTTSKSCGAASAALRLPRVPPRCEDAAADDRRIGLDNEEWCQLIGLLVVDKQAMNQNNNNNQTIKREGGIVLCMVQ